MTIAPSLTVTKLVKCLWDSFKLHKKYFVIVTDTCYTILVDDVLISVGLPMVAVSGKANFHIACLPSICCRSVKILNKVDYKI